MQYDAIKKPLGKVFNSTPWMRKVFYHLLDLLLLRSWHIRRQLRQRANARMPLDVLDAGSGFGQYDYFMSSLGSQWKITGVDVKIEQIEDCNQFFKQIDRYPRVQFQYADLTRYVRPQQYDFILSVDVMEHIEEDEMVFSNFYESLKPGGFLLISTPSDQGGSDSHHHGDEVTGFIDEHVRDGYNIRDINEKLKRAGFNHVDCRYTYGAPGKLSWKLSMKYPILMVNFSKLLFVVLPIYYLLVYPFCFVLNYFDLVMTHKTGTGLMVTAIKEK
jgi:SAM-dependent methyltransferase